MAQVSVRIGQAPDMPHMGRSQRYGRRTSKAALWHVQGAVRSAAERAWAVSARTEAWLFGFGPSPS